MSDATLSTFVRDALLAGASREETERVLLEAGWSGDQVSAALNEYSAIDFAVPVPRPKAHLSARDAFLYLVMFAMLYLATYNLGNLLFQFINQAFPDPAVVDYGQTGSRIRFATAALLVSFPVFLFVATRVTAQVRDNLAHRNSAVRKWLTYLTLAVAACIIVGDLIYLLYSLLSGELTARFVLKALVVGGLAGAVFAYYLWTMRVDDEVLAR